MESGIQSSWNRHNLYNIVLCSLPSFPFPLWCIWVKKWQKVKYLESLWIPVHVFCYTNCCVHVRIASVGYNILLVNPWHWRLVPSILGLGSMENVCYSKIKLSSNGLNEGRSQCIFVISIWQNILDNNHCKLFLMLQNVNNNSLKLFWFTYSCKSLMLYSSLDLSFYPRSHVIYSEHCRPVKTQILTPRKTTQR